MGRLERHISIEILALTLARIAARKSGKEIPAPLKRRPRFQPRQRETYRASWRNERRGRKAWD